MSAGTRVRVKTMKNIAGTLTSSLGFGAKVAAYTKAVASIHPKDLSAIGNHTLAEYLDFIENQAKDWLRLTTYFFYPIQQCAQQVYHTALPLSPTSLCLDNVIDDQLPHVSTFTGAPNTWGLLLRTVNLWPRQLTCIATSAQMIITACNDIVNIYDAVTFVPQQSIQAPETVAKIQGSPDGSILFFSHSLSVTMWDVQTGGLIHTFTVQSQIDEMTVSTTGDHLACGLSSGSIVFWDTQSKEEGNGFGNGQPVITIHWLSPEELAVATRDSIYIHNIIAGETSDSFPITGHVWGMVYLEDSGKFLVGFIQPESRYNHFVAIKWTQWLGLRSGKLRQSKRQPPTYSGQLFSPTLVGEEIACRTQTNGVQLFNCISYKWTNNPPLLDAAISVAVSLNRNLVVQTKNSIQIFSIDVLESREAHRKDARLSHVYPLGKSHIIGILQQTRCLVLLELDTLRKIHPDDNTLSLVSLLTNPSAAACGLISYLGVSVVVEAWHSGTPLPGWPEEVEEDTPLHGWSPERTHIVTVCHSPWRRLRVRHAVDEIELANIPLEGADFRQGKVYDLIFDSETRFHLKVDGPDQHIQIPYDITASPSRDYSHTITKGEPVNLSEPREIPPFTLDANCEWVLDAESRKICWVSPENLRKGGGGHFWAGLSLVMVGDDGVARKVTLKEPNC